MNQLADILYLHRLGSFNQCLSSFVQCTALHYGDERLCLPHNERGLTVSVSVAECVVFVLLLDFHLHCLAPALECKQDPLPGSVQRQGSIQSVGLHVMHGKAHPPYIKLNLFGLEYMGENNQLNFKCIVWLSRTDHIELPVPDKSG